MVSHHRVQQIENSNDLIAQNFFVFRFLKFAAVTIGRMLLLAKDGAGNSLQEAYCVTQQWSSGATTPVAHVLHIRERNPCISTANI